MREHRVRASAACATSAQHAATASNTRPTPVPISQKS
jgi:hypothetical protein